MDRYRCSEIEKNFQGQHRSYVDSVLLVVHYVYQYDKDYISYSTGV